VKKMAVKDQTKAVQRAADSPRCCWKKIEASRNAASAASKDTFGGSPSQGRVRSEE
jgi:hypothetical protein